MREPTSSDERPAWLRKPASSGLVTLRRESAEPVEEQQGESHPELQAESAHRLHRRFDRIGRLVGDTAMQKLLGSHVMVIGLGGVGSWPALASGA
jgi:hypothetical protein